LGFVFVPQHVQLIDFIDMPKLTNNDVKRTFGITARFTAEEHRALCEAAERLNTSPALFAREVLLASIKTNATDRLILAKTCKVEAMLQLLFGGLFQQLNEQKRFEQEHFRQALETAEAVQFRKADEHMTKHIATAAGVTNA
jgi:SpoVK/Ycf46/Vps4 family AAA+-type ATPase